jgi:hypothetical protein
VNGYEQTASVYQFVVSQSYLTELSNLTLVIENDTPYCSDNGCINLYLTSTEELNGDFVISRSSEFSNYGVWEDI